MSLPPSSLPIDMASLLNALPTPPSSPSPSSRSTAAPSPIATPTAIETPTISLPSTSTELPSSSVLDLTKEMGKTSTSASGAGGSTTKADAQQSQPSSVPSPYLSQGLSESAPSTVTSVSPESKPTPGTTARMVTSIYTPPNLAAASSAPVASSPSSAIPNNTSDRSTISSSSSLPGIAPAQATGSVSLLPSSPNNAVAKAQSQSSQPSLPGLITAASPSASSSSSLPGGRTAGGTVNAATTSTKVSSGAVVGFVALGCIAVMVFLLLGKKIKSHREKAAAALLPAVNDLKRPGGRVGRRGSRGWNAIGSPMERAASWIGGAVPISEKDPSLFAGGSTYEKGSSRDTLYAGNRAGVGATAQYALHDNYTTPPLPTPPSAAYGNGNSNSYFTAKPSAYVVNQEDYDPTATVLAPGSRRSSKGNLKGGGVGGGGAMMGGGSHPGSMASLQMKAPPPSPIESRSVASSFEELADDQYRCPPNTSTEDLLSSAASASTFQHYGGTGHGNNPLHTPHPPSSAVSSAYGHSPQPSISDHHGRLVVANGGQTARNSVMSVYSNGTVDDEYRGEYAGVQRNRLYDNVVNR